MKKRFVFALLLSLVLMLPTVGMAQNQTPGEGVSVKPAVANWQSALPVEAIVSELLGELGYDVQPATRLANALFYQAVAQGSVDFWANSWMPQQANLLTEDFRENASFVGTIASKGAIQGYMASKEAVEEFGITSLADFKRPEVLEAFDGDGNGKIEMLGCQVGWACADIIEHHMETYGLTDVITVLTPSYSPGFADVLAQYRNGEPVLYYAWTPNFTHFELRPGEDVLWINVPEIVPTESQQGVVETMTASGIEGAVTDPIKLGFSANDIQVAANNAFLEENPAARALFERVEIPLPDITEMTVRIRNGENSEEAITAMAREWIEANRDTVIDWLEAARAAAGQ